MEKIHLGFEVPSGDPVSIPLHHMCISGLTQMAGKTTTIEALVRRLPIGIKALVFRTKRGEVSFTGAHKVEPFYRQTTGWEYIEGLLEATMKERMRVERSFIIKACKGTKTLREVFANIQNLHKAATRGFDESVWTNLEAYFSKILPELEQNPFATTLDLLQGSNVMDLGHINEEVQALVISACLKEVSELSSKTIIVIPEAWKYIPQTRGNPVKWQAQHVIRQGAAIQNFLWLDSQDIANIDKAILKSVDCWLLGRQREMNEVQRVLDQLPMVSKPKAQEIMTLDVGQFYVCAQNWVRKVYVQPVWLSSGEAQLVAKGDARALLSAEVLPQAVPTNRNENEALTKENEKLVQRVETLAKKLADVTKERDNLALSLLSLQASHTPLKGLETALRNVLAIKDQVEVSEERIEARVLAKLGSELGQKVFQVTPVEALREIYKEQAVGRLVSLIEALSPLPKEVVRALLAIGKPCTRNDIAKVLGKAYAGNDKVLLDSAIKPLAEQELITQENKWLKLNLRGLINYELDPYNVPSEDLEKVYERLYYLLTTSIKGGG